MQTTITNHEAPFVIFYSIYPGQEQTNVDPGFPHKIDILDVTLYGESLSNSQVESFIKDYGQDYLERLCFCHARANRNVWR